MTTYPIVPMAKPRMTQRDKWAPSEPAQRYFAYRDRCRAHGLFLPECGAKITFVLPMPKSWPEKKKCVMVGKPHQQRPDLDNLLKALADVYKNDAHIWQYDARKVWGRKGCIIIERMEK